MSSSRALALLAATWIAAPGCLLGGRERCATDADCDAGEECTRTGECVAEGTALRVVLRWTVGGEAPTPASPAPCEGIGELEIVFRGDAADPESYRPVPCELGQSVYDKMPPRYDRVDLVAYGSGGERLDAASARLAPSGASEVQIDLAP